MKVSVIIVSYNVAHFLRLCLASVARAVQGVEAEVIVVDNASADESAAMVRRHFPEVRLLTNEDNAGFSRANNQAVASSTGEYVLFLNPDTVMPEDFLRRTLAYMDAHPTAGALGPRLIDGSGRFAPDGKKGFPSLSVALYKTLGFGRLFPKSARFNRYYAAHVGERETAAVEGLSGCCMLVRRSAMVAAGGPFDEAFFMYCEDVDLCYRITQAGYDNVYFPEVDLIHYKGESTRKSTVSYIRIFNEALATFVRKHYRSGIRSLYLFVLQGGIFLRAVLALAKAAFKALRLPLADALALLAILMVFRQFWVEQVKNQLPIPWQYLAATFPVYILLWIGSLYLNGAYDKPYRPLRVARGMAVGTVLSLAYFGLLPAELRYSRGVVILSGITGAAVLLALHELLDVTGIYRLQRYDVQEHKAVIVANAAGYADALSALSSIPGAPVVIGQIAPATGDPESGTLALLNELPKLVRSAMIDEVIFCAQSMPYADILDAMQRIGPARHYRIQAAAGTAFVGSNSLLSPGSALHGAQGFAIANAYQRRNKRTLDIGVATTLLLLWPLVAFVVKKPPGLLRNIVLVLAGRRTWVAWPQTAAFNSLPQSKPGVVPPWVLQSDYRLPVGAARQTAQEFAMRYTPGRDLLVIRANFRWLGGGGDGIIP